MDGFAPQSSVAVSRALAQLRQLLRSALLGEAERRAAAARVEELTGAAAGFPVSHSSGETADIVFISTTSSPVLAPALEVAAAAGGVGDALARVRQATALHVQRFLSRARREAGAGIVGWIARMGTGAAHSQTPASSAPALAGVSKEIVTTTRVVATTGSSGNDGQEARLSAGSGLVVDSRRDVKPQQQSVDVPCTVVDLLSQPGELEGSSEAADIDATAEPKHAATQKKPAAHAASGRAALTPRGATAARRTDIRHYTTPVAPAAAATSAASMTRVAPAQHAIDAYLVWRRVAPPPAGVRRRLAQSSKLASACGVAIMVASDDEEGVGSGAGSRVATPRDLQGRPSP